MTVLDTKRGKQYNHQLESVDPTWKKSIGKIYIVRQLGKFGYIGKYPDYF